MGSEMCIRDRDDVDVGHLKSFVGRDGQSTHLEALLRRGISVGILEGLSPRGHQENPVEGESMAHLAGHSEVADVDRIERPSQDADAAITHFGDGCLHS